MAVGKVEQIITIRGDDQASKVVGEVQSNFAKMGERLKTAGEFFGDLERVGRGFKDILGETASKELQDVLDKLGGMESLIIGGGKAFGPWGAAAGAAIGVGIVAYQKLSAYFQQDLTAAQEAQAKSLEIAQENEAALANRYLIVQDVLEAEQQIATAKEAETALRQKLQEIAKKEAELLKAIKEDNEKAAEAQDKKLALQREAKRLAEQLQILQIQERENALAQSKTDLASLEVQRQIVFATSDKQRREIQLADLRKRVVALYEQENTLRREGAGDESNNLDLNQRLVAVIKERLSLAAQILGLQRAEENEAKKSFAGGESRAAKRKRRLEEIAKFESEEQQRRIDDVVRQANETLDALDEVAQARIAAADISEQAALKVAEIERKTAITRELVQEDVFINEETRAARLEALRLRTATEIEAITTAEAARLKALEDKRLAEDLKREEARKKAQEEQIKRAQEARKATQDQISQFTALVGPAAAAAEAIAGPGGVAGALAVAVKETDRLTSLWAGEKLGADAVIGAVGAVAAATVEGEREKAAILAITSAAQAAMFYATGNIPAGIAATAAAALYGAAAGGLIGGGASAPSGGGGGFAAAAGPAGGGGGGAVEMGGATTVINFNAPLGTPYEIGKSVAKSQKAASAGGWSPRMAMGV